MYGSQKKKYIDAFAVGQSLLLSNSKIDAKVAKAIKMAICRLKLLRKVELAKKLLKIHKWLGWQSLGSELKQVR